MARTVRDAALQPRTARLRLKIRPEPYWRGLEKGFALGYRRRAKGGTWLARRRLATGGGYAEHQIGTTDDLQDADGVAVLDYAQDKSCTGLVARGDPPSGGPQPRTGPYTVSEAMVDYLKALQRRGGKSVYETTRAAEAHILPTLGPVVVTKLTARKIGDWHQSLAEKPPRARTKLGHKPKYRRVDKSKDSIRRRRATANRILTVLKLL